MVFLDDVGIYWDRHLKRALFLPCQQDVWSPVDGHHHRLLFFIARPLENDPAGDRRRCTAVDIKRHGRQLIVRTGEAVSYLPTARSTGSREENQNASDDTRDHLQRPC